MPEEHIRRYREGTRDATTARAKEDEASARAEGYVPVKREWGGSSLFVYYAPVTRQRRRYPGS